MFHSSCWSEHSTREITVWFTVIYIILDMTLEDGNFYVQQCICTSCSSRHAGQLLHISPLKSSSFWRHFTIHSAARNILKRGTRTALWWTTNSLTDSTPPPPHHNGNHQSSPSRLVQPTSYTTYLTSWVPYLTINRDSDNLHVQALPYTDSKYAIKLFVFVLTLLKTHTHMQY